MFKISRPVFVVALAVVVLAGGFTFAWLHNADADKATHWVTLGTNSGPLPNPQRSEPANLLQSGGKNILVDVGEGAPWQLSKLGIPLGDVDTIIISHLHFDHTSGLFAFLSLRYQGYFTSTVTIYGPPGTKRMVDALNAAMLPMTEMPSGMWSLMGTSPDKIVNVVELKDGSDFTVGDVKVRTIVNSHYTLKTGSAEAAKFLSFSYRFETPLRTIVYTGDTGPSEKVEELAQGADLLVSEIMDPDVALAKIKEKRYIPFFAEKPVLEHFRHEHLSPTEVGLLASRAHVKALALTHNALPDEAIPNAGKQIAESYKGPVTFANDLDRF